MSNYGSTHIIKGGIFMKIADGKPNTVRLLDESPTEQYNHRIENKLTNCLGEHCPHCAAGHSKKQRWIVNVWSHSESQVMLWSFGSMVAQQLKDIAANLERDGMDILDHDLQLSATGSGLSTKYSVQVRIKSQAVPAGIKLHDIRTERVDADGNKIPF